MIMINMIFRGNEDKRKAAIEVFKEIFDVVFSTKSDKEANEVFSMISIKGLNPASYKKTQITTQLYGLQKYLGVEWTKTTNILELVDNIQLYKPKEPTKSQTKKKKK